MSYLYRRKSRWVEQQVMSFNFQAVALDEIQARLHGRDKLSRLAFGSQQQQTHPAKISNSATTTLADIPLRPSSRAVCHPSTAARIAQLTD